jgi:hypothetical protein
MAQQQTKLVAPEPRQPVGLAGPRLQELTDLAQQFVAGDMAAGVVDDLELVEIDIQKGMTTAVGLALAQRLVEFQLRSRAG